MQDFVVFPSVRNCLWAFYYLGHLHLRLLPRTPEATGLYLHMSMKIAMDLADHLRWGVHISVIVCYTAKIQGSLRADTTDAIIGGPSNQSALLKLYEQSKAICQKLRSSCLG